MPIIDNVETFESPEWWFKQLATRLVDRNTGRTQGKKWSPSSKQPNRSRPGLLLLDEYLRGEPPLNKVAVEWQDKVREFMRNGRLHLAELIVSSTTNRMQLRDFRTAAANDESGDDAARTIMRRNNMSLMAREVHDLMCGLGCGYVIITPPGQGVDEARPTSETPLEVITIDDPMTGEPRAGIKLFRDDFDSADVAYVYLPGGKVRRAINQGRTSIASRGFVMNDRWDWDDAYSEVSTPDGKVPVIPFPNKDGVGEFERHLGTLDRINEKIANEWWLGKLQAHRQGAIEGLPDEDDEGNEIDYDGVFTRDPSTLWRVPQGVKFWESAPVDMGPVIQSIEKDLHRLAAVLAIPLSSITPDAAQGSAEGASLMREEHVFKVEDRRDRADVRWAQVMARLFAFSGDAARADVAQIQSLWAPMQRYSVESRANAAAALWGKLPAEAIFTDILQYAPADIPNLRAMAGRDLIYGTGASSGT